MDIDETKQQSKDTENKSESMASRINHQSNNNLTNHRYYTRSKAPKKVSPENNCNNVIKRNNHNGNKQKNNLQPRKAENVTISVNDEINKCYTFEPLTALEKSKFKCVFNPYNVCIHLNMFTFHIIFYYCSYCFVFCFCLFVLLFFFFLLLFTNIIIITIVCYKSSIKMVYKW